MCTYYTGLLWGLKEVNLYKALRAVTDQLISVMEMFAHICLFWVLSSFKESCEASGI